MFAAPVVPGSAISEGFKLSRPRRRAADWRVRAMVAATSLMLMGAFATIEALARV